MLGIFFFCSTRIWGKKKFAQKNESATPCSRQLSFLLRGSVATFPAHLPTEGPALSMAYKEDGTNCHSEDCTGISAGEYETKTKCKITFKKYALFQRMLGCQLLLDAVGEVLQNFLMRSNRTTILLIEKKLSESWGNHWVKANDDKLWFWLKLD